MHVPAVAVAVLALVSIASAQCTFEGQQVYQLDKNTTLDSDFLCLPSFGNNRLNITLLDVVPLGGETLDADEDVSMCVRESASSPELCVDFVKDSSPRSIELCFTQSTFIYTVSFTYNSSVADYNFNATYEWSTSLDQFTCPAYAVDYNIPEEDAFAVFLAENGVTLLIIGMVIIVGTVWAIAIIKTRHLDDDVTTTTTQATDNKQADAERAARVAEANKKLASEGDILVPDNEPVSEPPASEPATLDESAGDKVSSGSRGSSGKKHRSKSKSSSGSRASSGKKKKHKHKHREGKSSSGSRASKGSSGGDKE